MKAKLIVSYLFFLIAFISTGQNNKLVTLRTDSIELIKSLMRKDRVITSSHIGLGGRPSKQYLRFFFLTSILNDEEITELTRDSSACLRVYAYSWLVHSRYKKKAKEMKLSMLKDSTFVPVQYGCAGGNVYVSAIIGKKDIRRWYPRKEIIDFLIKDDEAKKNWYRYAIGSK